MHLVLFKNSFPALAFGCAQSQMREAIVKLRNTEMYGRIFAWPISSLCQCQRSVICTSKEGSTQYGADVVEQYGNTRHPLCQGIDCINFLFQCSNGNTMEKIVTFTITSLMPPQLWHTMEHLMSWSWVLGNDGWCKYSLLFWERQCNYPPAVAGCFVNDVDLLRTITSQFTLGRAGQSKDKDTELTVPTGCFKI